MQPDAPVTAIAHVIQLAVAPVFLLSGLGAMLGVLTSRLNRIIDRARFLENQLNAVAEDEHHTIRGTLTLLSRRARLVQWAIGLCTTCALLICAVIVVLFLQVFLTINMPGIVASLFIAAMLIFIAALLGFLREVHLAIRSLRIGPSSKSQADPSP